jgi:hypothetical protein
MSIAAWPKLSQDVRAELRDSEDFLTSATFGLMRFASNELVRAVLRGIGIVLPADDELSVTLWPSYPHQPSGVGELVDPSYCEPDAVVTSRSVVVLIEAKFTGSRLGHYLSQLGREWLVARSLAERAGWGGPFFLMITRDERKPPVPALHISSGGLGKVPGPGVTPEEQILQFCCWAAARLQLPGPLATPEEVARSVKWTAWQDLERVVGQVARAKAWSAADQNVLRDMTSALLKLGCRRFGGWRMELPALPPAPKRFFREAVPRRLWKFNHPDLPPLSETIFLPSPSGPLPSSDPPLWRTDLPPILGRPLERVWLIPMEPPR